MLVYAYMKRLIRARRSSRSEDASGDESKRVHHGQTGPFLYLVSLVTLGVCRRSTEPLC